MKIWQLNFELDKYDNFITPKELTVEDIQSFDGRSKNRNWTPLLVKKMEPEKNLMLSDAPGFFIPVFSKRSLLCLQPLINNYVEILPLNYEEEYYGINITTVLDAIDYSKSKYITFSDGKRILAFERYVFLTSVVSKVPIFKIIDEKTRYAFVSDEFKKIVEKNKLTGFKFTLVWDSEN